MASGDTKLSICSDSLIMLGAAPLSSFSAHRPPAFSPRAAHSKLQVPSERQAGHLAYPWRAAARHPLPICSSFRAPPDPWRSCPLALAERTACGLHPPATLPSPSPPRPRCPQPPPHAQPPRPRSHPQMQGGAGLQARQASQGTRLLADSHPSRALAPHCGPQAAEAAACLRAAWQRRGSRRRDQAAGCCRGARDSKRGEVPPCARPQRQGARV